MKLSILGSTAHNSVTYLLILQSRCTSYFTSIDSLSLLHQPANFSLSKTHDISLYSSPAIQLRPPHQARKSAPLPRLRLLRVQHLLHRLRPPELRLRRRQVLRRNLCRVLLPAGFRQLQEPRGFRGVQVFFQY